jgi:hypothetical protein
MPEIMLTPEQAGVFSGTQGIVTVRLPNGDWAGNLDVAEAAIVAKFKQRRALGEVKTIPHDAVMKMLAELQSELDRVGHVDPAVVRKRVESLCAQASHVEFSL